MKMGSLTSDNPFSLLHVYKSMVMEELLGKKRKDTSESSAPWLSALLFTYLLERDSPCSFHPIFIRQYPGRSQ